MKKPRDLLLDSSRSQTAQLDRIRENVCNRLRHDRAELIANRKPIAPARRSVWVAFWEEILFPCRRVFLGISAVWMVIVSLNFLAFDGQPTQTLAQTPSTPEIPWHGAMLALNSEIWEWLESSESTGVAPTPSAPPKPGAKPRGDYAPFLNPTNSTDRYV